MDAVELPLPTTVVSKLLVSEGFGRVQESETRDSGAVSSVSGGASVFSAQKPSSSCGSFHRDLEHDPISRHKRNDDAVHDNLPTSSNNKENGKKLFSGEDDFSPMSWPKCDGKQLDKKRVKRRRSPKQARTDHLDFSMNTRTIKGCAADKSGIVKHKRRQESRSDRKNLRTTVKAKFDSFMSRDYLVNAHSAITGSNIFGTFGVKFDGLDFTKNVDELSLSELLDGSYKSPSPCHDKVKKDSSVNESLLLSVRKAASILRMHGTAGSSGSRKAPGILSSTDCDGEEKCVEESTFSNQDQATVIDSALYQPKDILGRLGLPAAQDLDSILVDSCLPLAPLKSIKRMGKASLPLIPWSVSKPIIDTNKSATNRSTSQGRWVRIGSSSCLIGEERGCFSELNLKMDDYSGASRPQDVGCLSPNLETVKLHDKLSHNLQICMSHDANATTKPIKFLDISASKKGSSVLSSYDAFNPMAMNMDSSHAYQLGCKESALVDIETGGILKHQGNEFRNQSVSNSQIQEISHVKEEPTVKDMWDHNRRNCYYPFNSHVVGTTQCLSRPPAPESSHSDYSPRLLAAAAILCDMASARKRNHDTGKAIWPSSPLEKAVKSWKPRPLIGKADGPKLAPKTSDPIKRTNRVASSEHRLMVGDDKSKTICVSNVGRGPLRWPVATENTYSTKFVRDFAVKPMQGNPVGLMGQMSSPARAERGYDGHRKHRNATLMTTSVSTSAIYVKEWGKGRHRRE